MERFLKDERGKASLLMQWQTWAIIGLVALVVGFATGIIPNLFADKGDTYVDLGYVRADGTEVSFNTDAKTILFMDPQTFTWYTDSSKTEIITGLWGELSVKASTNLDVDSVRVQWTRELWYTHPAGAEFHVAEGDGSDTISISLDTQTEITGSKYTYTLPPLTASYIGKTFTYTWQYDVVAWADDPSGESASDDTYAEGSISAYWSIDGTLTITAAVDTGTLELVA